MTLRFKTFLGIGLALVLLVGAVYAISSAVLLRGFARAEEKDTRQAVNGVRSVLTQTVQQFNTRFADWSAWDDAYAFMADRDAEFIKSNLNPRTFADMQLDLLVFAKPSGEIHWGSGYDRASHRHVPLPEEVRAHLRPGDPLIQNGDMEASAAGIFLLSSGPMYVCARPVITSEHRGPIRGTLITGRKLDGAEVRRLGELTRLPLTLAGFDDPALSGDFRAARSRLAAGAPDFVHPLDEETVAGYTAVRDLYGKPAFLLRATMPREIYRNGKASLGYLMGWLAAVVGLFTAFTLFMGRRLLSVEHQVAQAQHEVDLVRAQRDAYTAVGHEIQTSLLRKEEMGEVEVECFCEPAQVVGGDFYSVFSIDCRRQGIIVGDVAGKGVKAAMYMTVATTLLQTLARRGLSPAEVLRIANAELYPTLNPLKMFATALYAVVDLEANTLTCANAGHVCPILKQGGDATELELYGLPLGAWSEPDYEDLTITLMPGEAVVFYSDGYIEVSGDDDQLLSFEGLRRLVARAPADSAVALTQDLLGAWRRLVGDKPAPDDLTLVVVHRPLGTVAGAEAAPRAIGSS